MLNESIDYLNKRQKNDKNFSYEVILISFLKFILFIDYCC